MSLYRCLAACIPLAALPVAASAQEYLNLSTVTATSTSFLNPQAGSFAGVIGTSAVSGSITTNPSTTLTLNAATPGANTAWNESTVNDQSQQYRYGTIFSPAAALTDRLGYTKQAETGNTARVTITFSVPVYNVVLHVSHLDLSAFDFAPTAGLTALTVLSGNGGGGDGLGVSGKRVIDLDNATFHSTGRETTDTPPTTGARSAYGSVRLEGPTAFSSISFDVVTLNSTASTVDNGNFTFSASLTPVPEPALGLLAAAAGLAGWRRWRATMTA